MASTSKVRMRIVSIAGRCPNGHRVGEEYVVERKTPAGICLGSFGACMPYLTALRFGASFPWDPQGAATDIGCPDPVNNVVWRLERI